LSFVMSEGSKVRELIISTIEGAVESSPDETTYRKPLVGFARSQDPIWKRLRLEVEPTHLMPEELLPGAKSAVAFFIPFSKEIVRANREGEAMAPSWGKGYIELNNLINSITAEVAEKLKALGVNSAAQPSTHNWNSETLVSRWSHRSIAYICGLGSFGLNRLLITDSGCAGRCGSFLIDAELEPTPRENKERCLYLRDGSCKICVNSCPVGALTIEGEGRCADIDKHGKCYPRLLSNEEWSGADACGKCICSGPCALKGA